jgi:hypothetical protein
MLRKKEEEGFSLVGVIQTRQLFKHSRPGHKGSKDLFVLNIPWERVVSYEVVHGNQGKRWFVSIGPRNRLMPGEVGVVIGRRARPWFGDDRWTPIVSDRR